MIWITVFFCLLVSFIFSGIEAGILSVNRVRLRHQVKLRNRAAIRLYKLLKDPERLLLTVVIVTNLMNICAMILVTTVFVRWWGGLGYLASFAVFLPLYLFALELFPKSLFRRFPYPALALLSQPLRLAYLVLAPVLVFCGWLMKLLAPPVDVESRKMFAAREDFKYITLESERAGRLTAAEREMIHNVVDFRAVRAQELMQPLSDFVSVTLDSYVEQLVAASEGGQRQRFLVVSRSGDILGMVNLFDAILDRTPNARISPFIRSVTPISAAESAIRVLRKLRVARTPVGLVMENGQPVGLIFIERVYKRLISPEGSPVSSVK
jgi:putative hemolysin